MASHYRVQNPATNEIIKEYPTATDQDIEDALQKSQAAFEQWRNTPYPERAKILTRASEIMLERQEELATITAQEMGKPVPEGIGEVMLAASFLKFYADVAEDYNRDMPVPYYNGTNAVIRKLPLGTLLGIMPWNFPYAQTARFVGPNLMNGNTIIHKMAEICPMSSAAFEAILLEAGLPEGVYINLYPTHEQVANMIADPRVQGVSLTGSEAAGKKIAEQAGRHLKKVVLELGGSDPYIVLDSSNVQQAAQMAWFMRNMNVGQVCASNKRMIVMADIYDEFVDAMVGIANSYQKGDPLAPGDGQYYPLSTRRAAEDLDAQVKRAVAAGAQLRAGGELTEGDSAYYSPTVLTDIPVGSDSYYEEFFGPVAEIFKVNSDEEAIALANNCNYGLSGTVLSEDPERAKRVASQVATGGINVNTFAAADPSLPFGGIKNSGYGREQGALALDEFVNKQLFFVGE